MKKIIVLHDRFLSVRGGENVAVEIAKTLNCPIYTSYFSQKAKEYLKENINIKSYYRNNFLNNKLMESEVFGTALGAFSFEELDLSDYDIIISSGSLSRSYIPLSEQYTINYCHTTSRWLYDLYRFRMNMLKWYQPKILAKFWAQWWRTWDLTTNNFINKYLCNSEIVQSRIKKYYNRNAEIIYPPIDISSFKWEDDCNYFLSIAGLYPEKRIDVAIKAFKEMPNEKLYIVGTGMNKQYQKLARNCKNIKFLGQVSEKQKQILLANCSALISIPISEDFGITPIETFASGKPVIGVREGYTEYQIKPYVNGLFVAKPTLSGLEQAVNEFQRYDWDIEEIQRYAKKYDISIFRKKIKEVVKGVENE